MAQSARKHVQLIVAANDEATATEIMKRAGFGPQSFVNPLSDNASPNAVNATGYACKIYLSENELNDIQRRFSEAGITVDIDELDLRNREQAEQQRQAALQRRGYRGIPRTTPGPSGRN